MAIPPVIGQTARSVAPEIKDAIQTAARRTGVSFDFLVKQAETESGFDPKAKAATSSATGLYQFIDRTWIDMVKQHGQKYGLADTVEALGANDPAARSSALALRTDPKIAAAMAAEYTKGNQEALRGVLSREPNATDLYMAHFLGPQGATRFLKAQGANGGAAAADVLPEAAAANRAVFFNAEGGKRSLDEVYARYAKRFESIQTSQASPDIRQAVTATDPQNAMRGSALFAAATTRINVLQALATKGIAPQTIAALAALDDHQGRTVAGRIGKRGII